MVFNHYSKMKQILENHPKWYIVRINQPTKSQRFNGDTAYYDHYYRVYSSETRRPIKFCKFQQLDRFAQIMKLPVEMLEVQEIS